MRFPLDPAHEQEDTEDEPGDETVDDTRESTEEEAEGDGEDEGDGDDSQQDDQDDQKAALAAGQTAAPETGEVEIVVGGKPQPRAKSSQAWARMRQQQRELAAENAELKRKVLDSLPAKPAIPDPGPKPKLSDPDIGYDEDVFEQKQEAWILATQARKQAEAQAEDDAQKARGKRQAKLTAYEEKKTKLTQRVPDYETREAFVKRALNPYQQEVVLQYAENSALVIAALGQSPELLKDLADTQDLGDCIAKVVKLEGKISMKSKNPAPPPERSSPRGGASSGSGDKHLERLRENAAKTGDLTPVTDYLRERKRGQKK